MRHETQIKQILTDAIEKLLDLEESKANRKARHQLWRALTELNQRQTSVTPDLPVDERY